MTMQESERVAQDHNDKFGHFCANRPVWRNGSALDF